MRKSAALALAACVAVPAFARTDVGVSIGINEPGAYGRIDIGNFQPEVVYAQPVIIERSRYYENRTPVYLYVPVEQQQHWRRYCHVYRACGEPVYFVQEQWVEQRWREEHPGWRRHHRGWDRWDQDRGEHRGYGY